MWLGEFSAGDTVDFKFTTRNTAGLPTTLSGTPVLAIYKDNGTTESAAGVTLTTAFDTVVGLNHVRITTVTDGTFYADGHDFQAIISGGTVSGANVSGEVVGHFTLRNRAALKPTTAGRTLDVSTGGEAGLDWANIGSPTTQNSLSATDFRNASGSVVGNVSGSVGSVVGSIGSVATNGITAASIQTDAIGASELAADAVAEIAAALLVTPANLLTTDLAGAVTLKSGTHTGAIVPSTLTVQNVSGNVSGSVGSVLGSVGGSIAGNISGSVNDVVTKTGYSLSNAGIDAILDRPITEPSGVFAWASASLRAIIQWLGVTSSNKSTATATTILQRDRADTVTLGTSTQSDDGTTYTRGTFS